MMQIDYTPVMCLMAAVPVALMFLLMLGCHWGVSGAAAVSMLASIAVGVFFYRAGLPLLSVEAAKGIWSALGILIVIWPAILIYEVTAQARAFDAIRRSIARVSPNMLLQILAIGWVFASFLQGVTGFGVPVAVIAPLLMAMGLRPVWAIVIPLLGQAWGNTFGTLAAAWDALAQQVSIDAAALSRTAFWTAIFLFIVNFLTGIFICAIYGRGAAIRKGLPAVLLISIIQGGGEVLLSQYNTALCCFLPSCLSLCAVFVLGRTQLYSKPWALTTSPVMDTAAPQSESDAETPKLTFHQAFLPYYVLTGLTLAVLLIPPVHTYFGTCSVSLSFGQTQTALGFVDEAVEHFSPITPFTNSGFFLLAAAVAGYVFFCCKGCYCKGSTQKILSGLLHKAIPASISIIALVVMARIMSGSGQILALAQGTAAIAGGVYGLLSPFIGMLGTFVTGSNVSSNVLFSQFQQGISDILGKDTAMILAAQTAGASLGSVISPSKLILGTTAAGIIGQEDDVLKKVLPFTLISCLLLGILTLLLA